MPEHPIEGLMTTAMQSIKDMVDVNTIVGDAVQAPDGTVIIPISKVSFGFAAGGGEYNSGKGTERSDDRDRTPAFPFAGGSGAGVSICPVAFMIVGCGQIKLMPVNINSSLDRILDLVPELFEKLEDMMKRKTNVRKDARQDKNTGETANGPYVKHSARNSKEACDDSDMDSEESDEDG